MTGASDARHWPGPFFVLVPVLVLLSCNSFFFRLIFCLDAHLPLPPLVVVVVAINIVALTRMARVLATLDNDCLVHVLGFLPMCDYMALALANKASAHFLVDDGVLRTTWGPRVGIAGRFDPKFGPHQCVPAADDPQIAWTVPRSWRAAAWLLDACRHAVATLNRLVAVNALLDADRPNVVDAIEPPAHEPYVLRVHRDVAGSPEKFYSWLVIWELRWRASLDARAGAAMGVLADMLAPFLALARIATVVPLSPEAARDLDRRLGAGFYGTEAYRALGHDRAPQPTDSIVVHVDRSIPCWRSSMNITALVTMAFSRASDVQGALYAIVDNRGGIMRAFFDTVDDWNGLQGGDLSEAHTDTWRDAIAYIVMRQRHTYNAMSDVTFYVTLEDLVPRARRRRAASLSVWCRDAISEFALSCGTNADQRRPLWSALGSHGGLDQSPFFEAVAGMAASAVLARAADADVPLVPDLTGLPHGRMFTTGAAAAASIALWDAIAYKDVDIALANMSKALEEQTRVNVDFDAVVLADIVAAWNKRQPTHVGHGQHARMTRARLALLLWATAGGVAGMRRLSCLMGSHASLGRLLSADACRDLVIVATDAAMSAVRALGAACKSHYTYDQSTLLTYAHASVFAHIPPRLVPRTSLPCVDVRGPQPKLRLAIATMAATADALAWCLGPEADLDASIAHHVRGALDHVTATHRHVATLLTPASCPPSAV
ncbi:hypothetical protein pqer_cds_201 [Pandoravirus quercus]|uniref:Uncharacterized protein n=1 Tax=Pandoravirus quercus TaxID=2107709 RepID=A0A2U7U866_9VIRU|nr:hypothetical protein pqer_cds_201 [Pandoravirus quercus]AVK74623.1 hypothetical protein pqer_cds_201 [Pandoravirus quercus]